MRPTHAPSAVKASLHGLLTGLLTLQLGFAQAAPAQKPLLKKPGGSVAPNVFYTMDDSGSMTWSYAPSDTHLWNNNNLPPLVHPGDTLEDDTDEFNCHILTPDATAKTYTTQDRWAMRLRSPDVNKIYYNPNIRYKPWAKESEAAGNFPQSSFTSAPIDPNGIKTKTINLGVSVKRSARLCATIGTRVNSNKEVTITPATYYRVIGTFNKSSETERFVQVRLDENVAETTDFPKSEERTDCVNTLNRCTLEEERANFANWFTYYRTRSLMARGASSLAFSNITQKVRVGYGQLNNTALTKAANKSATEAGESRPNVTRGVRDFDVGSATRQQFFNWLYDIKFQNGTPLRTAMFNVGEYFSVKNSTGPWGTTPGPSAGTNDANTYKTQASCRRSYHILMTDGYWNDSRSPKVGNFDGTTGPVTIANNEKGRTYKYDPTFTNGINNTKSPYADTADDTLADLAQYYWMTDLHPDLNNNIRTNFDKEDKTDKDKPYYNAAERIDRLDHAFWQHLTTYTVGLGVTGEIEDVTKVPPTVAWPKPSRESRRTVDDLFHAAVNGRGKFLQASNPQEYQQAMEQTLNEIFAAEKAVSGLSLSSFQVNGDSLAYVPGFSNPQWTGDVEARLASDMSVVRWTASKMLPEAVDRKIFVNTGNGLLPFDSTLNASMRSLLGDSSNDLINFLRGDRSLEGKGYRCRGDLPGTTKCTQAIDKETEQFTKEGLFGDVVNSNPVLLTNNLDLNYQLLASLEGATYRAFKAQKAKRVTNKTGALVVGANDGMLHVLDAETGREVFAYIPQAVVGNLKRLSNKNYGNTTDDTQPTAHRFMVDGKLNEHDVVIGGKWANVVVGSTGAGGKSVFALKFDAEKPNNFSAVTPSSLASDQNPFLWEINDIPGSGLTDKAKLGYITGSISAGRMKSGQWVAVFGNGADSTNGGAHLWIVDIATGAPIKVIQAGTIGANGLGPVTLIRDGNRNIVGAYAGDLKGNLWRFDLESSNASDWRVGFSGRALLSTSPSRPITAAPVFTPHPKGGLMVMFGTGQVYANGDETNADKQSLYGVWDLTAPGTSSATKPVANIGQIVPQTIDTTPVVQDAKVKSYQTSSNSPVIIYAPGGEGQRGWKVEMGLQSGERMIFNPFVLANIAFFNSVAPSTSEAGDPCMGVQIKSYLYGLNPFSGQMPTYTLHDTDSNGVIDGKDKRVAVIENDGEDGSVTPTLEPPKVCVPGAKDCKDDAKKTCEGNGGQAFQIRSSKSTKNICLAVGFSVRSWQQLNNFPKNPNLGK